MPNEKIYVLIACEESQAECMAFRERGFEAFSCDVQMCQRKGHPEWHICSDVSPLLSGRTQFYTQDGQKHKVPRWDLIIAHPPCTYLCVMGSVHLYKNPTCYRKVNGQLRMVNGERFYKMQKAREFFLQCLNAAAPYVAVENPCPMRAAALPPANAFACPSWYGCKYTKKTYYWLKNLPPLFAQFINTDTKCLVDCTSGKYRSRTYIGLAKAIATQWGDFVKENIHK